MARYTTIVEIDNECFAALNAGAKRMDISTETYAAVLLEQHLNRERRQSAATPPPDTCPAGGQQPDDESGRDASG